MMEAEALQKYLIEKLSAIQDEDILLALRTIVDKHLQATQDNIAHQDSDEVERLTEEVEAEEQEQEIEDWLKKL